MEIVLHLGAHRTATTTLQRMMGASRAALDQAKMAYWGPKRTRSGLFHGLIGQTDAVMPWQISRTADRVRAQIAQHEDEGAETLLVSEENMLGSMREVLENQLLYPNAGARVARFVLGMGPAPKTVGIAIRSYDSWWASVLAFRMLRGGPLPHAGFCAGLVAQPRRWRDVITDVARALPEASINVWHHEDFGCYPDAVIRHLTGHDLVLNGARAHRNKAASIDQLRCFLDDCGENPSLIRTDAGDFMPFDPNQRAMLRAQYAEDRDWLAAGAEGLATYLTEPGQKTQGQTGHGRGRPDDGRHRRLA